MDAVASSVTANTDGRLPCPVTVTSATRPSGKISSSILLIANGRCSSAGVIVLALYPEIGGFEGSPHENPTERPHLQIGSTYKGPSRAMSTVQAARHSWPSTPHVDVANMSIVGSVALSE